MQRTKSILSQYKDEIPVVNLKEAPPVDTTEVELDEDYIKDNEVQVIISEYLYYTIDNENGIFVELLMRIIKFRVLVQLWEEITSLYFSVLVLGGSKESC